MGTAEQELIIEAAIRRRENDGFPLSNMTFAGTELDDEGLALFVKKGIDVEELFLMGTKVSDQGIGLLKHFKQLKVLDVEYTDVTTLGLASLLPNSELTELSLHLSAVSEGGFAVIAQFTGLRSLSITKRYRDLLISYDRAVEPPVDSADLDSLRNLMNLEHLSLRGLPLQNDSLTWLASMHSLQSLDLSNIRASPRALANLALNQALTALQLSNTGLDDETLMHLSDNLALAGIGLANTRVTDAGVFHLAKNSALKSVFAEDVSWSREACEALLKAPMLENAELEINGVPHAFLESVCPTSVWLHPK